METPSKKQVIDTILENVDIRGIELENYQRDFEDGDLYEGLCEIFGVEPKVEEVIEETTYSISVDKIRKTCGWDKFCKVTGYNEWCLNEGRADNSTKFDVTESQAEQLGLFFISS